MKRIFLLARRELFMLFVSPLAYVVSAVHAAGVSVAFMHAIWIHEGGEEPLVSLFLAAQMLWLPVLVTVATMRTFAEERRSGTIEGLLTAPVFDSEIVIGKFLAAWWFCLLTVALPFVNVFWLARMSGGVMILDHGALAASFLYLVLVLAAFCGVGVLASLCSRSQPVAAMLCMAALSVPLFVGLMLKSLPGVPDLLVRHVSVEEQVAMVSRGVLTYGVGVLFLSICACTLFVSVRLLEARRWVR